MTSPGLSTCQYGDVCSMWLSQIVNFKSKFLLGLDKDKPENYQPISNLNTISKVLERAFLSRVKAHITTSANFNQAQSAYRQNFSTETALLATLNDIYQAVDEGCSTVLVALDISAAFNTIKHSILINRLARWIWYWWLATIMDWVLPERKAAALG